MADKKKVDPVVIRIALEYGIEKARKEAPDYFDKFPPSILPGAVEVTKDDWVDMVDESIDEVKPILHEKLAQFLGSELPEIDDDEDLYNPVNPPDPEPDPGDPIGPDVGYGHSHKLVVEWEGEWMTHRNESEPVGSGTKQRLFRFEGCGPDYGDSMVFEWDDGEILYVPNSASRIMNPAPDKRKYQPGCGYGSVPDMEVYAPVGSTPSFVTMYYSKDNVEPSNPDSGGGTSDLDGWKNMVKLTWGGDPNQIKMPNNAENMDFDRAWYSCTDHPCRTVVRQFEIEDKYLPSGQSVYVVFSDGHKGTINNVSSRMQYFVPGTQIKYVAGKPGAAYVYDRKSDIACAPGSKCEWIKIYYGKK